MTVSLCFVSSLSVFADLLSQVRIVRFYRSVPQITTVDINNNGDRDNINDRNYAFAYHCTARTRGLFPP